MIPKPLYCSHIDTKSNRCSQITLYPLSASAAITDPAEHIWARTWTAWPIAPPKQFDTHLKFITQIL